MKPFASYSNCIVTITARIFDVLNEFESNGINCGILRGLCTCNSPTFRKIIYMLEKKGEILIIGDRVYRARQNQKRVIRVKKK